MPLTIASSIYIYVGISIILYSKMITFDKNTGRQRRPDRDGVVFLGKVMHLGHIGRTVLIPEQQSQNNRHEQTSARVAACR